MSKEYPTLKPGEKITCKSVAEATALGANLRNEGFSYQITGTKIFIMGDEANEARFKKACERN